MIVSILALLMNNIVPFGVGLFFYVISPLIRQRDLKISEVSRISGIVILIIVCIWFVKGLLNILF